MAGGVETVAGQAQGLDDITPEWQSGSRDDEVGTCQACSGQARGVFSDGGLPSHEGRIAAYFGSGPALVEIPTSMPRCIRTHDVNDTHCYLPEVRCPCWLA